MFDLFEDELETMTPEKRKAWLDSLSEAAKKLEKHS
jgi:truncated hemoglobin YjbI